MSLKVPCKYCGKEISLRKMPSGQFVPFDKWTNSPHQCQGASQAKTANKNNSGAHQENVGGNTSVGSLVMQVISESPGIKAKQIASIISRKHGVQVDKSEVNRWLYSDLKSKAYQNGSYEWFPGKAPSGSAGRTHAAGVSVESGSYYGRQFAPIEETPAVKTGLPGNIHPSGQQGANKLLWGIIALLVVIVMILLNK